MHPKNHNQLQYVLLPQISLNPYKVTAFFVTPKIMYTLIHLHPPPNFPQNHNTALTPPQSASRPIKGSAQYPTSGEFLLCLQVRFYLHLYQL